MLMHVVLVMRHSQHIDFPITNGRQPKFSIASDEEYSNKPDSLVKRREFFNLSLSHALMASYFSPTAPPFCFWNWMYRIVLARKASADGSGEVESLCISVVINSSRPWIVETVIWGFPFSKK